jgi:hypothetical protein
MQWMPSVDTACHVVVLLLALNPVEDKVHLDQGVVGVGPVGPVGAAVLPISKERRPKGSRPYHSVDDWVCHHAKE